MKKLICLLLSIIMIVITFTGCTYYDDSTDESTEEYTYEETTEEETTETTTEPTTRQLDINFSAPNKMYVGNGMILKGVSQHTTIDDDNNITIELTVKVFQVLLTMDAHILAIFCIICMVKIIHYLIIHQSGHPTHCSKYHIAMLKI